MLRSTAWFSLSASHRILHFLCSVFTESEVKIISGLKVFLSIWDQLIVLIFSSRVVKLCTSLAYRECKMFLLLATHYSLVRYFSKIGLSSRIASVLCWQRMHQSRGALLGNGVFYCFPDWSLTWRGFLPVLYSINYLSSSPHLHELQCFAYWWFILMCAFRK